MDKIFPLVMKSRKSPPPDHQAEIQQECWRSSIRTPSRELSNPDQPLRGREKVLKTFVRRSRAGGRGRQDKSSVHSAQQCWPGPAAI